MNGHKCFALLPEHVHDHVSLIGPSSPHLLTDGQPRCKVGVNVILLLWGSYRYGQTQPVPRFLILINKLAPENTAMDGGSSPSRGTNCPTQKHSPLLFAAYCVFHLPFLMVQTVFSLLSLRLMSASGTSSPLLTLYDG